MRVAASRDPDTLTLPEVQALVAKAWRLREQDPDGWKVMAATARTVERSRARCRRLLNVITATSVVVALEQPTEAEPTITPEDTLREAGVSRPRQARYQRRMSSLLAGRQGE